MEIVNKIDESTRFPLLIWPCYKFHSPVGLLLLFCSCMKGCMQNKLPSQSQTLTL